MIIATMHGKIDLNKKTVLMGVLNITPDSFSDGGKFFDVQSAVSQAKKMINEGADIIDIGGESTRPGAEKVSPKEELKRVIPVIETIRKNVGEKIIISIDTYKSEVAKEAILKGVDIINDVSGLQFDNNMPVVAAELKIPVIINHIRGNPKTMQKGEIVYKDVIQDIADFFAMQIKKLEENGVAKTNIILDPGFGFGKTVKQNMEILKRFNEFKKFSLPLMIGVSRKSTIGKILYEELGKEFAPDERLEGSLAATAVAVLNGANVIRTHDVGETRRFLSVLDKIRNL